MNNWKGYFLANESLPYLIFEHKSLQRVEWEVEKFKRRMKNPKAEEWWIEIIQEGK